MLNVRLASDHLYGKLLFHLAVAGDLHDGAFLCCPFSHEMSWMRFGTQLSQFLRVFMPTLTKGHKSAVTRISGVETDKEPLLW